MLNQMDTRTSTTRHVFRQRAALGLAAVCGLTGLLMLLSVALSWVEEPQPLLVAWVLFTLAVVWTVFVRPAVLLDAEGVTLRNVLRDVHIPWVLVSDVDFRWNLRVFAGDRGYTAWAISSQVERPKSGAGGIFGILPGRIDKYLATDAPPAPAKKVTAASVAQLIEQARQEYDEAVARGQIVAAPDARTQIIWVPLVVAVLLLPAIAVVAISLT